MFEFRYYVKVYNHKKNKIVREVGMLFLTYEGADDYIKKHEYELKKNEQFVIETK